MAGSSLLVSLNATSVWAYVVACEGGFRLRVSIDDWERLGVVEGQRVRIRVGGRNCSLYVEGTREEPPVVWTRLVKRIGVAV